MKNKQNLGHPIIIVTHFYTSSGFKGYFRFLTETKTLNSDHPLMSII